jgi:hypothetical protein
MAMLQGITGTQYKVVDALSAFITSSDFNPLL